MTAVAATASDGRAEAARWTMCFAVVVAAHGVATMALLNTPPEEPDYGVDLPVVMLDLPPSVVSAPATDLPEGPRQEDDSEQMPQPKEETKPLEPEADVAIPIPEPPKLEPQPEEKHPTAPQANAPRVSVVRWQNQLMSHIERFKRYPDKAHGALGSARVSFTIDQDGHLLSSSIIQSSGQATLDDEALAILARAQPLPRPPDQTPDADLTVIFQMNFKPPR
jgi:periplasmic protein TonB